MTAIMIDQREPDYIKSQFPDGVVTLLETGDAWIACDDGNIILIERKASDDLLASIRDGRLLEQISRLIEPRINQQLAGQPQTYWPYLVITGTLSPNHNGKTYTGRETGWAWNAVQGALLTVQEMGCYIVHCPSDTEYSAFVNLLVRRNRENVIDIYPQKQPVAVNAKTAFLMGLPNIGIDRARELLKWGGSIAYALCGVSDLRVKAPIGEITRKNIRTFLGLSEQQTLEFQFTDEGKEILVISEENHV